MCEATGISTVCMSSIDPETEETDRALKIGKALISQVVGMVK